MNLGLIQIFRIGIVLACSMATSDVRRYSVGWACHWMQASLTLEMTLSCQTNEGVQEADGFLFSSVVRLPRLQACALWRRMFLLFNYSVVHPQMTVLVQLMSLSTVRLYYHTVKQRARQQLPRPWLILPLIYLGKVPLYSNRFSDFKGVVFNVVKANKPLRPVYVLNVSSPFPFRFRPISLSHDIPTMPFAHINPLQSS